jgi:hypothetical protein
LAGLSYLALLPALSYMNFLSCLLLSYFVTAKQGAEDEGPEQDYPFWLCLRVGFWSRSAFGADANVCGQNER